MAGFTIEIQGKAVEIRKTLADLEVDLKDLKKQLSTSLDSRVVARLNQEIKFTETAIRKIKGLSTDNVGLGLSKGFGQANATLIDFSRTINDIPFGIMGVANNISPMIDSFGRLKAETGSTTAALKAMSNSLIGPAGIGLAINLVTSAFLIYQNGILGFNKKTKEAKDQAEEFIKTLKSTEQVAAESAAGEEGNIAKIRTLASVISDQTASYVERNRALTDLKTINKSYFGDLTLEESKLQLLTSRVNEYIEAIKAQAVVKGFESEIGRVSVELAKQDIQLKKTSSTLEQARAKFDATPVSISTTMGAQTNPAFKSALSNLKEAEKAFTDQRDIVEKLSTNYAELNGQIDAAVKQTLKFKTTTSEGGKKEEDALKKQLEFYERIAGAITDVNRLVDVGEKILNLKIKILNRDAGKQGLTQSEIQATIDGYRNEFQEVLNKQAVSLEAKTDLKLSAASTVTIPDNISFFISNSGAIQTKINDAVSKAVGVDGKIPVITLHQARVRLLGDKTTTEIEKVEELQRNLSNAINEAILGIKVDAIAGLGEIIGAALTGGMDGFKQQAKAMLSSIGGVVSQLGKYIITTALKIQAVKKIIEKWAIANPALAVAAGIGLVALGSLLRNVNFGGPKLAGGGIVDGATTFTAGEAGKEIVAPLSKLPQIISSLGGNAGGNFTVGLGISDRELYAFIERAQRRFNRNL